LVSNNIQLKTDEGTSTKTGLDNIKKRYNILTGREVEVFVTRDYFRVSLPLITPEVI